MIRILLLALSVFSLGSTADVRINELKWRPELITKESILANYENMTPDEPPLFSDIPQLVFLSNFTERDYPYAEKNAKRIEYVSFSWFLVGPQYDEYETKMDNVRFIGDQFINQTLIQNLRKANSNIKIVPRFQFTKFAPGIAESFVRDELLVQRSARTIVNFCHEHGFDGAVIAWGALLSKVVTFDEDDLHSVDLYRNMLETLEQVGNVIRKNGLIAIFAMQPPFTGNNLESLESETEIFLLPPQFCHKMMDSYDFVNVWLDDESTRPINRQYFHDRFLEKIMKFYNYSPKLFIGIIFYGYELPLDAYLRGENGFEWKPIGGERFLEILKKDDAILTFNEVNKEHELTSESANAFILYPSLTQLEYRLAHIKQHPGVGLGIWAYGNGLPYFTNLL
ncbi:hypothetical protein CAEBREN_24059 [Caenorhabditis brenneri]|uniref:GH18 domain-containing protein n=1 Tax=Caenorhabditis brenneri TaxID=135651 RepID=G0M999_CAEBE|nr:hypothetical protein CAEBREN_24059 [Caenorhabditis brenneri]